MQARHWVVFGACLTQFTVIGLLFSYGLFFKVFEAEFGWSRTLLSACSAVSFLVMGVLAVAAGRLNDRFGPRRVLAVTGTLYGVGFVLMSQVTAPWQLLAIFATFIGLGLSTHDVVTLSTVARWFAAKRGIMSGVVKVGTAAGQVVVPLVAAFLIVATGWRNALVVMGVSAALLLLVAAMSMRMPPLRRGQGSLGEIGGDSYDTARRSPVFRSLCAIQFLFFPSLVTVPTHIAVHGMDLGMTAGRAAGLLSVIGAASVAGRLVVGHLVDRIGGRNAMAICLACLIASVASLTLTAAPGPLYAVMAVYGFAHGGLFTVVSPTVAGYFGMKAHGQIFGTVLFFGTIGGSIAPILAGYVFDTTASYLYAFAGLGVMAAAALALSMRLPEAAGAQPEIS